MEDVARQSRESSYAMQSLSHEDRNELLQRCIDELNKSFKTIMEANKQDLKRLESEIGGGPNCEKVSNAMGLQKRLDLSKGDKLEVCVKGIRSIIEMKDPLDICTMYTKIQNGLDLYRISCPIGVLAIIYEARPEAAIQIISLCIKTGNSLILKGGKEALHSNFAIFSAIQAALKSFINHKNKNTITKGDEESKGLLYAIQLVDTREAISELLKLNKYIDLIIPRGSKSLVESITMQSKIPVLGHADGLCCIYVDEEFENLNTCIQIIMESKFDYAYACNAMETLLIHPNVASSLLSQLAQHLKQMPTPTVLKCCKQSYAILEPHMSTKVNEEPSADGRMAETQPHTSPTPGGTTGFQAPQLVLQQSTIDDYRTEFLNHTFAIQIVQSIDEAIHHINAYSSHHTDCIISKNAKNIEKFMKNVDSAGVFNNCSTRFADGFRYGFGAEVGISTNKIHARGPVGLEGLVTYKYRLYGNGHLIQNLNPFHNQFHRNYPTMSEFNTVEDIRKKHM